MPPTTTQQSRSASPRLLILHMLSPAQLRRLGIRAHPHAGRCCGRTPHTDQILSAGLHRHAHGPHRLHYLPVGSRHRWRHRPPPIGSSLQLPAHALPTARSRLTRSRASRHPSHLDPSPPTEACEAPHSSSPRLAQDGPWGRWFHSSILPSDISQDARSNQLLGAQPRPATAGVRGRLRRHHALHRARGGVPAVADLPGSARHGWARARLGRGPAVVGKWPRRQACARRGLPHAVTRRARAVKAAALPVSARPPKQG